jgi:hypothetical protein
MLVVTVTEKNSFRFNVEYAAPAKTALRVDNADLGISARPASLA